MKNVFKHCVLVNWSVHAAVFHTSAQRLTALLTDNRVDSMSYPLCWTVLLHDSIKRSFPTLPPVNPGPSVHNVLSTTKQNPGVDSKRFTQRKPRCSMSRSPFVSYASCLFTPIQCPPDPRRLSSNGFFSVVTQTDLGNVLSRAAYKSVMVASWSFGMGWSPTVMCVFRGVVWAGELEAVWSPSLSSTAPPMDTTVMSLERQRGGLTVLKEMCNI